ncbi:2-C-methyl-D-erythritol 2,4-cyclodiphosphate synthase [uncultured Ruthenibacterium sp.]|uniref:2-C-methyl-D-erythritol 2,4-cyclodiphosphate synthase n=1 Tax=uncultured Ruthenibacterium sp. TaxID=1905347 RepID=UPI00349EC007
MIENRTVAAIIVAAGNSTRMGFDKLLYNLDGQTVLEKSVRAFDEHPAIDELVIVVGENAEKAAPLLQNMHKPVRLVPGGATRAQSVQNGLAQIRSDFVAVHDAARPFVSQTVITAALNAAFRMGAAAPAVPVKDTVKVIGADGMVKYTPDRSGLYAVQTPQCFRTELYRKALRAVSNGEVTDDCSVLELAGVPVQLTQGDYANYKITTREDLPVYREERQMHIGHGYDVHRLVEGRKLILGGVEIPYDKGLLGHSDADVLTHAVMDALLGAAALGDIGHLFPDNDPAYEGADSIGLLRKVGELLKQQGWDVENLDATILCQAPKLAPHIAAMRENISRALGVDVTNVSVKATTEEKLGFTGAGDGIAAHCVCLLTRLDSQS